MNVLALDGALGAFSAAIARDGTVVASGELPGNTALEGGLGLVARLLTESGVEAERLDRLAVGAGPGGFTGLRIAIAYAKSLAQAWECPLVPITSFDLLEYGRRLDPVVSVVVGRTGIVSARFRDGGQTRRASGPIAEVVGRLLAGTVLPPGGILPVLGAPKDVLAALAERGIIVNALDPLVTPAAAAAALAAASLEPARSAHAVRADYGELPAAKIPKPNSR